MVAVGRGRLRRFPLPAAMVCALFYNGELLGHDAPYPFVRWIQLHAAMPVHVYLECRRHKGQIDQPDPG